MKKINNEGVLCSVMVLVIAIISVINPNFLTVGNFIDMIRSSIVTGIFAVGAMMVMISGGIDVSFPAIAAFAMYSTTRIFNGIGYEGGIVWPFLVSMGIGAVLGTFNAFLVHHMRIPTFIATIGTQNLFSGILLTFIGSNAIMNLPKCFTRFAKTNLITVHGQVGNSSLPVSLLFLAGLAALVYFIMQYTVLGRGIYAVGGSMVSARRIGFSVALIQYFLYSFVGAVAGAGGLIHTCLMRTSNPFDVLGTELSVIAAVVLGGTSITGGRGTIRGTLMGVFTITIISNSLILIGISTYWQRAVLGSLIIVSIALTTIQNRRKVQNGKHRVEGGVAA